MSDNWEDVPSVADSTEETDFSLPEQGKGKISVDGREYDRDETSLSFTKEEKVSFEKALTIGKASTTVEVFGHTVAFSTVNSKDELQVSEVVSQWTNTTGFTRAYRSAVVAAAVQEIDGQPLYVPISAEDHNRLIVKKYEKILDYYPIFVDEVFKAYQEFEQEILGAVVEKLGK